MLSDASKAEARSQVAKTLGLQSHGMRNGRFPLASLPPFIRRVAIACKGSTYLLDHSFWEDEFVKGFECCFYIGE